MTQNRGVRLAWPLAGLLALTISGVLAFGVQARPAAALTNCTISDGQVALDAEEAQFLSLINNYRASNGLGALTASANLNRAAAWLAQDLGANRYFSHTDSLGRSPSTRAQNCGYPSGAGENIAAGTVRDTAQEAFDAWKASSGHNANMLNSSYRMIGIARQYVAGSPYGWYWVTDFGLVSDGTSGGGGGGGGTTTPTPPPATNTKAAITSPSAGSTLPGSSATFSWNAGSGAQEYFFYVGTSTGSNNIYGGSQALNRTKSVSGLPTNGATLYVRLWTRFSTGWQYNDYTYKAATAATTTPPPASAAKAAITSPAPGSTLPGSSATFAWNTGSGAHEYFLYVGTSAGSNNIYGGSTGLSQSRTVSGIPANGSTVYVRLWTRLSTGWQYTDYTYRAAAR
ncbi:MAG: CAP domain-containing protein [Dehalococcoidia bacterium]|nr:CAP domain-containing protein [Dehalococcoidia bacterium]